MRKLTVTVIYLFGCFSAIDAQNHNPNFKFYIGALYRITPVYLEGARDISNPRHKVFIEQDRQLTSGGITTGIAYFFRDKSFYLMYNQILRYGYIHTGPLINFATEGVKDTHYGLMTDFQFSAFKNFPTRNENNITIGLGYSLMNRGTSYTYVERTNSVSTSSYTDDLNFSAINLSIGYEIKEKLKFELMNYITGRTNFNDPGKLLLFELRASCFFDVFKKSSE